MAEPFCNYLRKLLFESAKELGLKSHEKGTVVTVEGPRFGTKAESHLFRQWKADVVNMSTVPECILAREAGICYAVVVMSTDYDCWKEGETVDIQMVLKTFKQNAENVLKLFLKTIPKIKDNPDCKCRTDIKGACIS
jgi:5'-methylthioadenosine phosphorylase